MPENSQAAGAGGKEPVHPFRYISLNLIWQCSLLKHDLT